MDIQDYVEYENEYNVFERVGGYADDELTLPKNMKDPIQKFMAYVMTVTRSMNDQGIVKINRPEMVYIVDKINSLPFPQYKNPTAFVLGYWVTNENDEIDKRKLDRLSSQLNKLDYPVRLYDIVRYGNLWLNMK